MGGHNAYLLQSRYARLIGISTIVSYYKKSVKAFTISTSYWLKASIKLRWQNCETLGIRRYPIVMIIRNESVD